MAAGEWCFCHRNIVSLKSRRRLPRRHQATLRAADVTLSTRAAGPLSAGQLPPSACNLPARMLAGVPNWQAIWRVDNPTGLSAQLQAITRWSRQNASLYQ
jgi:hypothetical protein